MIAIEHGSASKFKFWHFWSQVTADQEEWDSCRPERIHADPAPTPQGFMEGLGGDSAGLSTLFDEGHSSEQTRRSGF